MGSSVSLKWNNRTACCLRGPRHYIQRIFAGDDGTIRFELGTPDAPQGQPTVNTSGAQSASGAVNITAGRDINNIEIEVYKPADISAGRNIVALDFQGQNLGANDIKYIQAGAALLILRTTCPTPCRSVVQDNLKSSPPAPLIWRLPPVSAPMEI